jgi:hypothetical protein
MKIVRDFLREVSLEEFCDENDIEIIIHERPNGRATGNGNLTRYYGGLQNNISTLCEIIRPSILSVVVANGNTEEDVLNQIVETISEESITFEAMKKDRRIYKVPRLISVWTVDKKSIAPPEEKTHYKPSISKEKFERSCKKCGYLTKNVSHGYYKCHCGECPAITKKIPK